MSQRDDLLMELREARPTAPAELREHVRRIAGEAAPTARRRLTWRRALVVAVPVAAVVAGAAVLLPRGEHQARAPVQHPGRLAPVEKSSATATTSHSRVAGAGDRTAIPAPASNRVQRITTSLELRLPNAQAVSDATKRAVTITRSLGGYPKTLNVDAEGRTGSASLLLRIPKQNVQRAVSRLSALGTIIGEYVRIEDLQAQVDATARKLARLEARLAYWQSQPASTEVEKHVTSLTAQIERLRRGRAGTIHAASYATLSVQMTTRRAPAPALKGHGPLHNLGVALRWVGIGAVYVLALAAPFVLAGVIVWLAVRAVRRHRENDLLSST